MGYHHLALAANDMQAIHEFYEGVMQFELVKAEIQPMPDGAGWAKHFFYRMEDDSKFIAFWEIHEVPGLDHVEADLNKSAGLPGFINHIAFDVNSEEEFDRRREQWNAAGYDVMEIDHNWCRSIYTNDPSGNLVEFCLTTGAFTAEDRKFAVQALKANDLGFSKPPATRTVHKA